jgi:hypothetical protein
VFKDEHTSSRTAEIKRLLAIGQYRIDPAAVADAMIRRGIFRLHAYPGGAVIERPLRNGGKAG